MIKVTVVDISKLSLTNDTEYLLTFLSDTEKKDLIRNRTKNKFQSSLVGRVITKKLVSDLSKISINKIVLGKTKNGQPHIKEPRNNNLHLSISHSGNYVTSAISDTAEIGVDIEQIVRFDIRAVANSFSKGEFAYIFNAKKMTTRLERFYKIWTLKEAFLKAIGIGMYGKMPVVVSKNKIRQKLKNKLEFNNRDFYLKTFKIKDLTLSICSPAQIDLNNLNELKIVKFEPNYHLIKF